MERQNQRIIKFRYISAKIRPDKANQYPTRTIIKAIQFGHRPQLTGPQASETIRRTDILHNFSGTLSEMMSLNIPSTQPKAELMVSKPKEPILTYEPDSQNNFPV